MTAPESDPRPRLVIVCGLPGSGKTTIAKRLEAELPALRLGADDWMDALGTDLWDADARARIEAIQGALARRALELGASVVIEWGTWGRSERDVLREMAHEVGASSHLHLTDAPDEVLLDRIRARGAEDPPIAASDLRSWRETIQWPDTAERALFDGVETTGHHG